MTRVFSLALILFVSLAVARLPSQTVQISRAVIASGAQLSTDGTNAATWTAAQSLIGSHGIDGMRASWGFWPSLGIGGSSSIPISSRYGALSFEPPLRIAPNPARDRAELITSNGLGAASVIVISDVGGRELMRRTVPHPFAPGQSMSFDVSGLAAGTYVLLVRHETRTLATLFTVAR